MQTGCWLRAHDNDYAEINGNSEGFPLNFTEQTGGRKDFGEFTYPITIVLTFENCRLPYIG